MPKKDKSEFSPSPIDEPSIGFAKPVGPPVWWYSALAVAIILFLLIILLSFFRFWLRGNSTDSSTKMNSTTPQPTNAPYRPNSILTPLAFENIQIDITETGPTTKSVKSVIHKDDVIVIINKDIASHTIRIQSKSYEVAPMEAFAYKVTTKEKVTIEILSTNGTSKVFAYIVQ